MAHVETIETYGGRNALGVVPTLVTAKLQKMEIAGLILNAAASSDAERAAAEEAVHDEYLAALLLSGANYTCFEPLREHLSNLFAMGDDQYPKTLSSHA